MQNNSTHSAADSPRARHERLLGGDPRLRRGCELKLRRDPIAGRQCPGCGSLNVIEAHARPPHWAKYICGECGKHVAFVGVPGEIRRARRYVLTFGLFKGQRLAEVALSARGLNYVRWLAREARGPAASLAEIFLEGLR
jgi:hypothetical protein